jgi:hypothetical protein
MMAHVQGNSNRAATSYKAGNQTGKGNKRHSGVNAESGGLQV